MGLGLLGFNLFNFKFISFTMKLYMKSLLLLLLLGTAASCNDSFLDQTQTSDLNRETVFADSTYTANFLTGIYTDIGFDINYNRWTYL